MKRTIIILIITLLSMTFTACESDVLDTSKIDQVEFKKIQREYKVADKDIKTKANDRAIIYAVGARELRIMGKFGTNFEICDNYDDTTRIKEHFYKQMITTVNSEMISGIKNWIGKRIKLSNTLYSTLATASQTKKMVKAWEAINVSVNNLPVEYNPTQEEIYLKSVRDAVTKVEDATGILLTNGMCTDKVKKKYDKALKNVIKNFNKYIDKPSEKALKNFQNSVNKECICEADLSYLLEKIKDFNDKLKDLIEKSNMDNSKVEIQEDSPLTYTDNHIEHEQNGPNEWENYDNEYTDGYEIVEDTTDYSKINYTGLFEFMGGNVYLARDIMMPADSYIMFGIVHNDGNIQEIPMMNVGGPEASIVSKGTIVCKDISNASMYKIIIDFDGDSWVSGNDDAYTEITEWIELDRDK